MPNVDLRSRTEAFAVAVLGVCKSLPHSPESQRLITQLAGAATSVAANYRAACRAQSKSAFIAKLSIVLEEADEANLWLDMLVKEGFASEATVDALRDEANQLVAIFVASLRTAKMRGTKAEGRRDEGRIR